MPSANNKLETDSFGLKTPFGYKILVMSIGKLAPGILTELEKLPGSIVQVCSSFVEMVLYLEHETFQLVMIIEGESMSLECQAVIDHLAKAHRGTPVLVTKRTAVDEYLGEASKCVN